MQSRDQWPVHDTRLLLLCRLRRPPRQSRDGVGVGFQHCTLYRVCMSCQKAPTFSPLHCALQRGYGMVKSCSSRAASLTGFAALVAAPPLRPLRGSRRARGATLGGPRALRRWRVCTALTGAQERRQRCVRPCSGGTRGAARSRRGRRLDQPLAGRHRAVATPVPCRGRSDTALTQLAHHL